MAYDESGRMFTRYGTLNVMAPEMHKKEESYSGASIDLFACGVSLLFLRTKLFPIQNMATGEDQLYRYFALPNMTEQFWTQLSHFGLSLDFQDLVSRMIEFREEHRLTLADVLAHPWMRGEVASHQQVAEEIAGR